MEKILQLYDSAESTDGENAFSSDESVVGPNYDPIDMDTHEEKIDKCLVIGESTTELQPLPGPSSSESVVCAVPATPATRKRRREANVDMLLESVIIDRPAEIKPRSDNFQKINWRKRHLQLHIQQINFRGAKNLPDSFKTIKTPYDCFEYFVDEKFYKLIADQTNLYARNKNINTKFMTNTAEIRKFVGIVMQMSVIRHYSTRAYWGKNSIDAVRNTMPCTQFETLRQNLHFNDNAQIIEDKTNRNYDPLFKVRPLINIFNERFGSVPMPQRLCVDEQMCSTQMKKNPVRQYMPAKPHKWGTKLFVLCDSAGFSYKLVALS